MNKVREEDIVEPYYTVSSMAALMKVSQDEIFSFIRQGDILISASRNNRNKIVVIKEYLIEFLEEQGLLLKKPKKIRNVLVDY
mgnify:CR=1 FL=1